MFLVLLPNRVASQRIEESFGVEIVAGLVLEWTE